MIYDVFAEDQMHTHLMLCNVGGEISSEPSYILFNTAVSSEWGFPKTCPANCPCKNYNCFSTDFREQCGFSEGFCSMMKNEVPKMRVNWVRVYQDPDDPMQKVGCSTPERPTRRYIEAHMDQYKQDSDVSTFAIYAGCQILCRPVSNFFICIFSECSKVCPTESNTDWTWCLQSNCNWNDTRCMRGRKSWSLYLRKRL